MFFQARDWAFIFQKNQEKAGYLKTMLLQLRKKPQLQMKEYKKFSKVEVKALLLADNPVSKYCWGDHDAEQLRRWMYNNSYRLFYTVSSYRHLCIDIYEIISWQCVGYSIFLIVDATPRIVQICRWGRKVEEDTSSCLEKGWHSDIAGRGRKWQQYGYWTAWRRHFPCIM